MEIFLLVGCMMSLFYVISFGCYGGGLLKKGVIILRIELVNDEDLIYYRNKNARPFVEILIFMELLSLHIPA